MPGPGPLRNLAQLLKDISRGAWQQRVALLEALPRFCPIGDAQLEKRAASVLRTLSGNAKWEVRRAVADVLHFFPFVEVQEALEQLTDDSNRWVRESAKLAKKRLRISARIDKRDRKYDQVLRLVGRLKKRYPEQISAEIADEILKLAFKTGEKYYEELATEVGHQTKTVQAALDQAVEELSQELLARKPSANGGATRQVQALIREIMQKKDNLLRIFRDFIKYSRPWDAPKKWENLHELLETALQQARREVRDVDVNKITIRKNIDQQVGFEANKTGVEQAICNLIVNAMEAMPKGGALSIRASSPAQDMVQVSIADTGCGMSQRDLAAYKRPGTSSKKDARQWRTGFGLPFAIKIIELGHDGRLTWETSRRKGTTVHVQIPVRQEDAP